MATSPQGTWEQDLLRHLPLSPPDSSTGPEWCGSSCNIPETARDTAVYSSSGRRPRAPRELEDSRGLSLPLLLQLPFPKLIHGERTHQPPGLPAGPAGTVAAQLPLRSKITRRVCFSTPRLSPGSPCPRECRPARARRRGHAGAKGSPVDQVGERLNQLLAQPWLQGGQSTKLGMREDGGSLGAGTDRTDPTPPPNAQGAPRTHWGLFTRREKGRSGGILASLIILMRTQLLVEEVISLKKSGARER